MAVNVPFLILLIFCPTWCAIYCPKARTRPICSDLCSSHTSTQAHILESIQGLNFRSDTNTIKYNFDNWSNKFPQLFFISPTKFIKWATKCSKILIYKVSVENQLNLSDNDFYLYLNFSFKETTYIIDMITFIFEVQSNFLVALKLFLSAKCSLSLWSKLAIGPGKWFLNTNLFLIKSFPISKFDCTYFVY